MADRKALAQAFKDYAYTMACMPSQQDAADALRRHPNELVRKAAAHDGGEDLRFLAEAYIQSHAELSSVDQIGRYGVAIPTNTTRVLLATGASGDVATEGGPKVVRKLGLSFADVEPRKAIGLVAITREVLMLGGDAGRRMFEDELQRAVTRAINRTVATMFLDSNTINVPSTSDALADLRAGLRAADASSGYVVLANAGLTADLSTRAEVRGDMAVSGGEFVPGVHVIGVDDLTGMVIVPAERFAVWAGPLEIRYSSEATINLHDTPESSATIVNLWQTNTAALLVERSWHIAQGAPVVTVGASS